jgi:cytochrome c-type biogenesis protein CcmF
MALLGRAVLILALAGLLFAVVAALYGRKPSRRAWYEAAERTVFAVFGLVAIAMLTLWTALLTNDFSLEAVANYSSRALSDRLKVTALWASQPGSLMLWLFILMGFSTIAILINRSRNRELMPVVVAVLAGIGTFFAFLLSFVTSPFNTVAVVPADGQGLQAALQNPYMIIHPPLLYLGYVAMSVPFAFAISALATGKLDNVWLASVRRWTILSWVLLGVGILLGSKWAYESLSFGGYWAWDPVENAAFMPWLVGTAFLHSVMVQERRGMLRVWNMVLVVLAFSLCIFGTFITRSGLLQSVHAFGAKTVGPYFLAFLAVVLAGSITLIIRRLPKLRSQNSLESYVSREAVFLYNNLLLVGLAFAIFWGTVFPILSEAVRGERISVGETFFDQVAAPIGVALLFLTGVGPMIPWRKASLPQLRRRFFWPLVVAAVVAPLLLLTDAWSHWAAAIAFTIGAFAITCIITEFTRGTRVRHALGGVSWPRATVDLVLRNRRRYGGYIVHVGIVLIIVGVAASRAFVTEGDVSLKQGETARVGDYSFTLLDTSRNRFPNRMNVAATIGVTKGRDRVATLVPQKNVYLPRGEPGDIVAIKSGPTRDIWVNLAGLTPAGPKQVATLRIFVNPMVSWIWLGGLIMALGALIAAWPPPRTARAPAPVPARSGRRAEA